MNKAMGSSKVVMMAIALALFCLCAGPSPQASSPRDITKQVYSQTSFDEQVQRFCESYCQGNESKGAIQRVTIQESGRNQHRVEIHVSLQNRHDTGPPLNMTPFDWTIMVRAIGALDAESCVLSVNDILVENDLSNIFSNYANQYRGTKHRIPDCERFLDKRMKTR